MKTSLKTLVASAMTAIIVSATVFSSAAAEKVITVNKESLKQDIKRIVIQGNTRVLLVQSDREWISVDEGEMDNVSVKQVGSVLTVSSSEAKPVVLTIYVKDLYRISASNNVEVSTVGTFNLSYLQLVLKDRAVARIKVKTESLYTDLEGEAKLDLSGATDIHTIRNAGIGSLKTERLAAAKIENLSIDSRMVMANAGGVKSANGVRK